MSQAIENLGRLKMADAVQAGKSVLPVLREFMKEMNTSNSGLFSGALSCALSLLQGAEQAGVTMKSSDRPSDAWLSRGSTQLAIDVTKLSSERDYMGITGALIAIAGAVDSLQKNGLLKVEKPSAGPLEVRVTAMPDRLRKSTIERNSDGSIRDSLSIESDI